VGWSSHRPCARWLLRTPSRTGTESVLLGGSGPALHKAAEHAASSHPLVSEVLCCSLMRYCFFSSLPAITIFSYARFFPRLTVCSLALQVLVADSEALARPLAESWADRPTPFT
jgi:hypothetical protein